MSDVQITRAVQYREPNAVSSAKHVDIYLPTAAPASGTVIYLHGGGWRAGSREAFEDIRQIPLARAGVAVVSADYTLTGEAPYPANLNDVLDVVDWVREHGDEYGIPTNNIVLGGASAGGHLAALAVLKGLTPGARNPQVDGVIAWFPGIDLVGSYLRSRNAPYPPAESFEGRWAAKGGWPVSDKLTALLGTTQLDQVSIAQAFDLDPRYHLDFIEDTAQIPPFLILTGSADLLSGPRGSAVLLHDGLRRVGAQVELLEVYAADHEDEAFGTPVLTGTVAAFVNSVQPALVEAV